MPPEHHRHNPPATIDEVAAAAGVGRATAARTLGNYGSVSPAVRARVIAAAEKLRYRPNSLARSMTTGKTQTLGVLVADIGNPFFAGVMRGIDDACHLGGYAAIVISTDENLEHERAAIGVLMDKQVDGIILASAATRKDDVSHIRDALDRDIPIVLLDRTIDAFELDTVVINNREVSRAAVDEFIAEGHRRIAFVWGPTTPVPADSGDRLLELAGLTIFSEAERLRGYLEALAAADIEFDPDLVTHGPRTEVGTTLAVGRMLELSAPPTALIATETDALVGALRAMRLKRLEYPGDISLISFDDSAWARVIDPPLTMIEQPMAQLGVTAAEQLLRRIDGTAGAPRVHTLQARIIQRHSIARPPQ
ncbi:substrate-binding domain-containing protein [Rathayibacter soli]|uniref:substrate-binding domain-containing protein n=1 Tax=Rathayibacter soli TaxID=3144168 RepID=UPI0027E3BCEA|nr:substrate-binding domain-containing protein [Glaciibacter superstes]